VLGAAEEPNIALSPSGMDVEDRSPDSKGVDWLTPSVPTARADTATLLSMLEGSGLVLTVSDKPGVTLSPSALSPSGIDVDDCRSDTNGLDCLTLSVPTPRADDAMLPSSIAKGPALALSAPNEPGVSTTPTGIDVDDWRSETKGVDCLALSMPTARTDEEVIL
jgi:hypothetical protein